MGIQPPAKPLLQSCPLSRSCPLPAHRGLVGGTWTEKPQTLEHLLVPRRCSSGWELQLPTAPGHPGSLLGVARSQAQTRGQPGKLVRRSRPVPH